MPLIEPFQAVIPEISSSGVARLLVVTATRGDSPWFIETARSIASARACGVDLHWVVVSAERNEAILRRVDVGFQFVAEFEKGLYRAINQGVAEAIGHWDWVTYINDDDGFMPDISKSVEFLSVGGFDVLYGDVMYVDGAGMKLGLASVCRSPKLLLNLFSQGIPPLTQQGTLVKREVFYALGGFSTTLKLASDSDFWARALMVGFVFRYEANLVAFYRRRLGQLSDAVGQMEVEVDYIRCQAKVADRGFWLNAVVVFVFRLQNTIRIIHRIFIGRSLTTSAMFKNK